MMTPLRSDATDKLNGTESLDASHYAFKRSYTFLLGVFAQLEMNTTAPLVF